MQLAKAGCHLHKARDQKPNWVCVPTITQECCFNTLGHVVAIVEQLELLGVSQGHSNKQDQKLAPIQSGAKMSLSTAERWMLNMDKAACAAAESASEQQGQAACVAPLRIRSSPRATHTRLECTLMTVVLIADAALIAVNAAV